jgi:transposase
MAIVARHGLPRSVSTHAANDHEVRLVQLCFDFYMIEAKPDNLIGDRAYDGDLLDDELRKDGIEMIAPYRSNRRKSATQDGRRLRRYARRWLVERFFAWIQWQRRLLARCKFYPKNFLGFGGPAGFMLHSSRVQCTELCPTIEREVASGRLVPSKPAAHRTLLHLAPSIPASEKC